MNAAMAACSAALLLQRSSADAHAATGQPTRRASNGDIIRVGEHISGPGDKTGAVQALIDSLVPGDALVFDAGIWRVDGKLTVEQDDITITLGTGAIVDRSSGAPATTWLESTGDRFILQGEGEILGPKSWNGRNVAWTFATILCRGASPRVEGITLTNVHKVGIGFKEADGTSTVEGVTIIGNYPAEQWSGVETAHFGITYDPSHTRSRLRAVDNVIKSCVQGVFLGNFGPGSSRRTTIIRNRIEGCHNHAFYNAGGYESAIFAENIVVDCEVPVVITGYGHMVANNTMYATGTGGRLNTTCHIQMRESSGGLVVGNRLSGDVWASAPGVDGAPAIDFMNLPAAGVNTLRDNVCIGNVIEISDTNDAIGIRVGSASTITLENNVVANNVIVGGGTSTRAAIVISGSAKARQRSAEVTGNTIRLTKPTSGIQVLKADQTTIRRNSVQLEALSKSATLIDGIQLGSSSARTTADDNRFVCPPTAGTNITFRGIVEEPGTKGNRVSNDRFDVDDTLLNAFVPHVLQGTSGVVLHERLPGAPTVVAAPGSTRHRTDGGPRTTFYIKESPAHLTTWRAI